MAALVFVLVGFPLGIRSHRGGRAVALASSFLIVVSYYILFTALEGMALSRRLPAVLAIWLPNLLFSALGAILLWSTTAGVSTAWLAVFWRLWARVEPRPWMRVGLGARAAPAHREDPRAASLDLPHRPLPHPRVSDVPRLRSRDGGRALHRRGPAPDARPVPSGQALLQPDRPALRLQPAVRAVQGPAADRAHRHRVPVPVPHRGSGSSMPSRPRASASTASVSRSCSPPPRSASPRSSSRRRRCPS